MDIWKSLSGMVKVQISTASVALLLTRISNAEIDLVDVNVIDDFTITANVAWRNFSALKKIVEKNGETINVINKIGLFWHIDCLRKRKLLIIAIILFLFLTIFLPTRILFVQIEGNSKIPSNYILAMAESSGVTFGASRREVRSERIKNNLLEKIPELQWTGINTYGCVAVISVKERSIIDSSNKAGAVSNIVAMQDGVIEQCTVLRGNSLCKVGQSVKRGQVLVSGYIDCGRYTKAVEAEAEIMGRTLRKIDVISPVERCVRGELRESKTNYSLLIGKNLIKLSQDSGISASGCVKMYEIKYITLPGGFRLPIALVIEQYRDYSCQTDSQINVDSCQWMYDYSENYLLDHIIAGKIISSDLNLNQAQGYITLQGRYICSEMIGQVKREENIQYNGKTY